MPIPSPERSAIIDAALKKSGVIEESHWPCDYITSPSKYVIHYDYSDDIDSVLLWDFREATIDFEFYVWDSDEYDEDGGPGDEHGMLSELFEIYFNPTVDAHIGDEIMDKIAAQVRKYGYNIIYSSLYTISIKMMGYYGSVNGHGNANGHGHDVFTEKVMKMYGHYDKRELALGILDMLNTQKHCGYIELHGNDSKINEYWWNLALQCDKETVETLINSGEHVMLYVPYCYCRSNGIVTVSAFEYGTPDEIKRTNLIGYEAQLTYRPGVTKRNFTIPIEEIVNIKNTWPLCIVYGILTVKDIGELQAYDIPSDGILICLVNHGYPGIKFRVELSLYGKVNIHAIDAETGDIIVTHETALVSYWTEKLDIWDDAGAPVSISDIIRYLPGRRQHTIMEIHPSFRKANNGCFYYTDEKYTLISTDASYEEIAGELYKGNAIPNHTFIKNKHYEYLVRTAISKRRTFLMIAARMGLVYELSAIIGLYLGIE